MIVQLRGAGSRTGFVQADVAAGRVVDSDRALPNPSDEVVLEVVGIRLVAGAPARVIGERN